MDRRMNKDGWGWRDGERKKDLMRKEINKGNRQTAKERSTREQKIRCQPTDIERQGLG